MNNRLKENAVDNFNLRMLGLGHGIVFQNKLNSARSLVARLQLTEELAFHGGCVNAVNFSSSGDLIVSGSDDMQVAVWDWLNCTKAPKVSYDSGHSSNVFQVCNLCSVKWFPIIYFLLYICWVIFILFFLIGVKNKFYKLTRSNNYILHIASYIYSLMLGNWNRSTY